MGLSSIPPSQFPQREIAFATSPFFPQESTTSELYEIVLHPFKKGFWGGLEKREGMCKL